jgi:hypothetical protein
VKLAPHVNRPRRKTVEPFVAKYFPVHGGDLKKRGAQPDERGDVFAVRLAKLAKGWGGSLVAKPPALRPVGRGLVHPADRLFNFINLTLPVLHPAREVGVRKTLGARKGQLFDPDLGAKLRWRA